jgi:hypothetical protein
LTGSRPQIAGWMVCYTSHLPQLLEIRGVPLHRCAQLDARALLMMRMKKKRGCTVCSSRRAWPACRADLARAAMHLKRLVCQGVATAHTIASCSAPF